MEGVDPMEGMDPMEGVDPMEGLGSTSQWEGEAEG